jgi:hypothetical protein
MATISKDDALRAVDILKSEIDDDEALEHHGIKGMKWGVRNQETLRKYGLIGSAKKKTSAVAGALSSKVSSAASAASSKAVNAAVGRIENARAKKLHKRQQKIELAQQRKELGMKKKDFDKLRETTLKSHDPRVVAKGMHTLSDEELKLKIKRLQEEEKISKMATSRAKGQYDVKKARNDALNANPVVSLGKDVASGFLKKSIDELGYRTIVQKGLKPPLEQQVTYAANKAQKEFSRTHPVGKYKISGVKTDPFGSSQTSGSSSTPASSEKTSSNSSASSEASGTVSKYYGMKPAKSNSSTMALGKAKVSMSDVKNMTPAEWDYKVSRNPKYDGTETVQRTEAEKRLRNAFLQ